MRDINELIRQRETETVRLQNEIERIQKELEALRLTAKLLDEIPEPTRNAVPSVPLATPVYNAAPSTRPAAATTGTPNTWASAKQFP